MIRNFTQKSFILFAMTLLLSASVSLAQEPKESANKLTPEQAQAIAKEAYIYGYPMIENYKTMYVYSVDKGTPNFKAPFNTIYSDARVFTPEDRTIVTPNSDTPYSFVWADLRAEPIVLGVPEIEKDRYYSLQFVDLYTYNFEYVGSRATGNGEGKFLLAGPDWKGETPEGIEKVIQSDTDFAFVIYRTQLFDPADIDNVKKIQAGYTAEPLSKFLGEEAPPAAPKIDFPAYNPDKVKTLDFFNYLNFVLQFAPTVPEDKEARAQFAKIGIIPGKQLNTDEMSPEMKKALEDGMAEGEKKIIDEATSGKSSADFFGTRESMNNNYLNRAAGARAGIYGNTKTEAYYYLILTDSDGDKISTAENNYTLTFQKDKLPPVNSFWSVTMYNAKTQLLIENPINRYLINSSMVPDLKKNDDGSLTIYIQKDSPGKEKESNWLPAPDGQVYMVLRAYWPKEAILDGEWKLPPVELVQ